MIVEPLVKGFVCRTAHPEGCRERVRKEIEYVKAGGPVLPELSGAAEDVNALYFDNSFGSDAPKNVVVIGCSTGYGLSARIAAAWGYGAKTLGICRERPSSGDKTASPGYYNCRAFEEFAEKDGIWAKTLNEDAFLTSTKKKAVDVIKNEMGPVDLIIYSLAAPKRTLDDGTTWKSVLKTTGRPFVGKDLNLSTLEIEDSTIECATQKEIDDSVKVMGGEDWYEWIRLMAEAGVLAGGVKSVAFSYIGPELTYPIYSHGTMGFAKRHVYETSKKINSDFSNLGIKACVSMNKSMVTQASIAIPRAPIYIALARQVMSEAGCYEGCIEQMYRLMVSKIAPGREMILDGSGMIRLDDYELRPVIQDEISARMEALTTENVGRLAGLDGYFEDFYHMFGFGFEGVDYGKDVEI